MKAVVVSFLGLSSNANRSAWRKESVEVCNTGNLAQSASGRIALFLQIGHGLPHGWTKTFSLKDQQDSISVVRFPIPIPLS
jgi:hypothetical protein